MKKLLLLTFLGCLFGSTLSAQSNFDLSLRDSIVTDRPDTVVIGKSYDLYIWVENLGSEPFDGNMGFNVYVTKDQQDLRYQAPQSTFNLDSVKTNHYSIAPGDKVAIKRTIYISDSYFKRDTPSVVIIWPTGSNKPNSPIINDLYRANSFARPFLTLYVESPEVQNTVTGINDANTPATFRLAPNPASDRLWLQLQGGEKGTLTLRDLQGRVILNRQVQAAERSLNLSLPKLGSGIYNITLQTASGISMQKFVVSGE